MNPGKMVPGKIVPGKNGPRETQKRKIVGWASSIVVCVWNVGKWSIYENPQLEKWSSEKWSPGKMVPGKMVPGELRNEKSWGGRRASWCVGVECWEVINLWKPTTRKMVPGKNGPRKNGPRKTQKRKIVGCASSIVVCVCVECSDVINLWKPKTRQQIFLDSFSVPQFGTYVGSWRKRQTFFCVCSGINW